MVLAKSENLERERTINEKQNKLGSKIAHDLHVSFTDIYQAKKTSTKRISAR
jgi:hypothetical protein